jgi:hypothetical protein
LEQCDLARGWHRDDGPVVAHGRHLEPLHGSRDITAVESPPDLTLRR